MVQQNKTNPILVYTGFLLFGLVVGSLVTTIMLNSIKIKKHIIDEQNGKEK